MTAPVLKVTLGEWADYEGMADAIRLMRGVTDVSEIHVNELNAADLHALARRISNVTSNVERWKESLDYVSTVARSIAEDLEK